MVEFFVVFALFLEEGANKLSTPRVVAYPPVNREVIYLSEGQRVFLSHIEFYHKIVFLSNRPTGMFLPGLAWRPAHRAPTEQVSVEMKHKLAPVPVTVYYDPVALLGKFFIPRNLLADKQEAREQV